jgi:hypothetical protein
MVSLNIERDIGFIVKMMRKKTSSKILRCRTHRKISLCKILSRGGADSAILMKTLNIYTISN